MPYLDSFNRPISYLRVSVTDRCNLRCVYCMSPEGMSLRRHDEILHYEEIERVVRAAASLGISKVRLTGGEPLVRRGLVDLVSMIGCIPGIDDLAMTTNGILLARYAEELKAAGLKRVNVSLDTLRPERFRRITRLGDLSNVLDGIAAAEGAGLLPLKINTVVARGMNDDEVLDFARLTLEREWHIRFIEIMPLGQWQRVDSEWENSIVMATEMRQRIGTDLGPLEPVKASVGNGPAHYYRLPGALGTIGFISPVSGHFCYQCNRLRLTADGKLRPCLLSDYEIDLRTPLRRGSGMGEIRELIIHSIVTKPERHHLDEGIIPRGRIMSEIGG
jgi:cyclic pyranopterin phosphate synthase